MSDQRHKPATDPQESEQGMSSAYTNLDARVDRLSEKLAAIDERTKSRNKTFLERLSQYGGLLALCISVVIGGYSIYDEILQAGDRERVALRSTLYKLVGEIGAIESQLAQVNPEDTTALVALQYSLSPQKAGLASEVFRIFEEYPNWFSPIELFRLANWQLESGKNELALKIADSIGDELGKTKLDSASSSLESDLLESDLLWLYARIFAFPSAVQNIPKARDFYRKAVAKIASIQNEYKTLYREQDLVGEWVAFELSLLGDCSVVPEAMEAALRNLQKRRQSETAKQEFIQSLYISFDTADGGCEFYPEDWSLM
jgi:hypothetical protein